MTPGFNGSVVELKEGMTRVMRALRTLESATLDGQRIYYNHIRPHQGLGGKTPAEAAGLDLALGPNKWEAIIARAVGNRREQPASFTWSESSLGLRSPRNAVAGSLITGAAARPRRLIPSEH
jgi:hypothetical protein